MPCKRSTLKKYTSRPSPPYPAQECPGKRKKGSDGAWYISSADKRGVYRWQKQSNTVKTTKATKATKKKGVRMEYLIHDNGSRPYRVKVGSDRIEVYTNQEGGEIVYQTRAQQVWIGDNLLSLSAYAPKGTGRGNTILLQVGPHRYVYIGHMIYSFDTGEDTILEYYSPIGNSDVPYPYAVGKKHVYFLLDKKRVAIEKLDLSEDGYTQFYRTIAAGDKKGFRVEPIHTSS